MTDRIETVEGFDSVLKDKTDLAFEKIKAKTQAVLLDADINLACTTMICARRLYALARFALHRDLVAEGYEWDEGIEEYIIQSMSSQADKAFSRADVLQKLETYVRKFVMEEVDRELEQERAEDLIRKQKEEEIRLAKKAYVTESLSIAPGEFVVCVGTEKTIDGAVFGVISNTYADNTREPDELQLAVVVFDTTVSGMDDSSELYVGTNKWLHCAKTRAGFEEFMSGLLKKTVGNRCDVLVIKDLTLAYESDISANDAPVRKAQEALKTIRRWAKENNVRVVAGFPVEHEALKTGYVNELTTKLTNVAGVFVVSV